MPRPIRQFGAAVAALTWPHWALALFFAALIGADQHHRDGGLLTPLLCSALTGLTWIALQAACEPAISETATDRPDR